MSRAIRGLMIKDMKLMKSQMKFFFALIVVWGIFMAGGQNMSFFVGYIAILCSFLARSTFSYDEFENGCAYLMTLPVLRTDYVFEKYLFGILLTTIPPALIGVISGVTLVVRGDAVSLLEYLLSIVIVLPMAYLLLALEIPLQIRFGQEKSRMVTYVLVGCVCACLAIISMDELAGFGNTEAVNQIAGLNIGTLILSVAAILIVLMFVSYKISCKFMERKEF